MQQIVLELVLTSSYKNSQNIFKTCFTAVDADCVARVKLEKNGREAVNSLFYFFK